MEAVKGVFAEPLLLAAIAVLTALVPIVVGALFRRRRDRGRSLKVNMTVAETYLGDHEAGIQGANPARKRHGDAELVALIHRIQDEKKAEGGH